MRIYQRHRLIAILALWSPWTFFGHPAPASEIKDGQNYRAEEAVGAGGALMVFRKQGNEVVGISYTPYWHACYHGSLDGSTIKVKDAVFQNKDLQTKEFSYEPVSESVRDRFIEIRFVNYEPFPNPGALIPTPSVIVDRDVLSLNECAKHFGGPVQTGPCNDANLQPTLETGDEIKYFLTSVACRKRESKNCGIDNVFKVMLATPSSIAPVKDIGKPQTVKNCGILVLKSFTVGLMGNNLIKTEIDSERYAVTNYTMPGHVFYPGRVIRWLVDMGDRIDINTQGLGAESFPKTIINIGTVKVPYRSVWDTADDELRDALLKNLKIPKTKPTL